MGYLYLLSEDDNDDAFYHRCVECLTGKAFDLVPTRLRRGSGLGDMRNVARLFLQTIAWTGFIEDSYFVIALDNDRYLQAQTLLEQGERVVSTDEMTGMSALERKHRTIPMGPGRAT